MRRAPWLIELPSEVIRIDALWACTAPVDMRAGADRLLSCVVQTLGGWCGARRLNAGHFVWPRGLAWQWLHERRVITRV